MNIYSIKDVKASSFNKLIESVNDQTICRDIAGAASDPNTSLAKWPGDFEVWKLGEYDNSTGSIKCDLRHVANVVTLVPPQPQEVFNYDDKNPQAPRSATNADKQGK